MKDSHNCASLTYVRLLLVLLLLAAALCVQVIVSRGKMRLAHTCTHMATVSRRSLETGTRVHVVVGVMVTESVPHEVVNACHYAVQEFNAAQTGVYVNLQFFVGQGGHPMITQGLATVHQQTSPQVRSRSLPSFALCKCAENMNDGKTYEWLSYAAEAFPTSDWIFKMDTDVAVDWMALAPWLQDTASHSLRYLGLVNDFVRCNRFPMCPPPGCTDMADNCWVYMSGGLYGMSTELARRLVSCPYYTSHRVGEEDLKLGKAVKHCAADVTNVQLINVPQRTAWCHSKEANLTHIRNGLFPDDCM